MFEEGGGMDLALRAGGLRNCFVSRLSAGMISACTRFHE